MGFGPATVVRLRNCHGLKFLASGFRLILVTHIESPVYCILVFRFLLIMPDRTLAAIMFTDMEGYTRLMQQDEKKAKQLCDLHRTALEEETEKRNGKIMQYYGDGSLSIYNSSIEAVACAISVQERIKGKVNLRIGLHVGDIVKDEDGAILWGRRQCGLKNRVHGNFRGCIGIWKTL